MRRAKLPKKPKRTSKAKKATDVLTDVKERRGCSAARSARAAPPDPVVDDQEADDHNESHADEDRAVVEVLPEAEVAEKFINPTARGKLVQL